jgi:succinate-semialdehyde dehydrogenase/glutarate-semialdehyde dehydrogenase
MTELDIHAPDDHAVVGTIQVDDAASVSAKVAAAVRAMSRWAATSPMRRAEALIQIAAATRAQLPELARALSKEQGKTIKEAELELDRYLGPFTQYAGLATVAGGRHQQLGPGVSGHLERLPVGVVVGIVPWNFPASLFGSKVAPALAAGCAFLIKPAETTSLVTQRLAGVVQRFLPPGLVDVVVGGPDVGEMLVSHPDVARVAFTGSTAVGRRIAARAGEGLKRISLELGGCDPFVLLEDADVPAAVRGLMGTRFYNAGQVCVAPKRLVVHERVADEAVALLESKMQRIVPGPGLDPASTMGPLHTEQGRAVLEAQVADAVDRGARLVGGGRPEGEAFGRGWFVRPALLLDPPAGARVRTDETFGPVLSVIRVRDEDEAVAVANETPYGLGASVWSGDQSRAMRVARQIPAGYTWINALGRVYDELPFGGVRASGMGREHGVEALDSYLEDRTFVCGTPGEA